MSNLKLETVFEHIGRGAKRIDVHEVPLGVYARECERSAAELSVAPPPAFHAARGIDLVKTLLERAADVARGIDKNPRRHIEIAAGSMTEREFHEAVTAVARLRWRRC